MVNYLYSWNRVTVKLHIPLPDLPKTSVFLNYNCLQPQLSLYFYQQHWATFLMNLSLKTTENSNSFIL